MELLKKAEIEYLINPHKKKLAENRLSELIRGFNLLITGIVMNYQTPVPETITPKVEILT